MRKILAIIAGRLGLTLLNIAEEASAAAVK